MALAIVLVAGMAACSDDAADPPAAADASATPSPAATAPSSAASASASAPSCVTARWLATGVTSSGGFGDLQGRIAGGTGTTMTVGPDGRTEVDFRAAQPLTFTAEAAGADVCGQVSYQGSFRGAVAFEGGGDTGRWNPQGRASWSDLTATVRLSEPFDVTLLDGANLADITRDTLPGTGGAVDVQPILRGGTYECAGEVLRLRTLANGPDVTWAFIRA